jgi:hypothetical protein
MPSRKVGRGERPRTGPPSAARAPRPRPIAQLGRHLARPLTVVVVVVLMRCWLGVWPTAVVLATVGTAGLLAVWAEAERRLFAPPPSRAQLVERRPQASERGLDPAGHAAFARALTAVAAAYLTECERQEREARP